jgi:hypothetical protein
MQCKWSGRMTVASILNGWPSLTFRNAERSRSMFSTKRRFPRRWARFSVKNQVALGTSAFQYSVIE